MVERASQNAVKRAQNTRLAAARSSQIKSLAIPWAALDMAHEGGAFKVIYAYKVPPGQKFCVE
jgi:hypothetical protein